MKKTHLTIVFFLIGISLEAQKEVYKVAVSKLVNEIYILKLRNLKEIRDIIDENEKTYLLNEKNDLLTYNDLLRDSIFSNKTRKNYIKEVYSKYISDRVSARLATDKALAINRLNEILKSLVYLKAISKDSLTTINENGYYYNMLDEMKLKNNDHVADIGAGSGYLMFTLYFTDLSLILYYNEIDEEEIQFAEDVFSNHFKKSGRSSINFVKGTESSTRLEKVKFHKIFMINTLHHFDREFEMLKSVKKSMDLNSRLFILENPKGSIQDQSSPDRDCKRALPERDMRMVIKNNELTILEEYKIFKKLLFWKVGI